MNLNRIVAQHCFGIHFTVWLLDMCPNVCAAPGDRRNKFKLNNTNKSKIRSGAAKKALQSKYILYAVWNPARP